MLYIKIFEICDKLKFRDVCVILRREDIRFEILYEYWLYSEKWYDLIFGGGVIIRVLRLVYYDIERFLI